MPSLSNANFKMLNIQSNDALMSFKNQRTNGPVNTHLISGPWITMDMMVGIDKGNLIYRHLANVYQSMHKMSCIPYAVEHKESGLILHTPGPEIRPDVHMF